MTAGAALGGWGAYWRIGMRRGQVAMVPDAVAIAADVDDVTVVQESVDQRADHDIIAEDLAPRLDVNDRVKFPTL